MTSPESVNPKLIAIDLDGTLLTSDKIITERSERAIEALTVQGVRVVLCTGRPPRMAKAYAEQLKLVDLAILHHGALVYDFRNDCVKHCIDMEQAEALEILERVLQQHPEARVSVETNYGFFRTTEAQADRPHETPHGVGNVKDFITGSVTKLLFRHSTVDAETMSASLEGLPLHCTWSDPDLLEVIREGVNKAVAVERIAGDFGVSQNEVAVFGDQRNDMEMIRWAGFGVAMGNAHEKVKAVADHITLTNDEDGVAVVLERWLR